MQKTRTKHIKFFTKLDDGKMISKELWFEDDGEDICIDYFRNYENLDQPYHAQMTLKPEELITFALNLIVFVEGRLNRGGKFTFTNIRDKDFIVATKDSKYKINSSEKKNK